MPELSFLELIYPAAMLLAAGGFVTVLRIRPEARSAFWFAVSFAASSLAFMVEFLSGILPSHLQALLGAFFYAAMGCAFALGLILRAGKEPPARLLFALACTATMSIWMFSLVDVPVLLRICIALQLNALALMIALRTMMGKLDTASSKIVFALTAIMTTLLFGQPVAAYILTQFSPVENPINIYDVLLAVGVVNTILFTVTGTVLLREQAMLIVNDLKQLANRDKLTGLLNRHGFDEGMARLLSEARREEKCLGLIGCDIDLFKNLNDAYGHNFGDQVIRAMGQLLEAHAGETGIAARVGGEEFVLVKPVQSLKEARDLADLIRQRCAQQNMYFDREQINFTASFGVSLLEVGEEKTDQAMIRADTALYLAKETGRDKVCCQLDLAVAELRSAGAHMRNRADEPKTSPEQGQATDTL